VQWRQRRGAVFAPVSSVSGRVIVQLSSDGGRVITRVVGSGSGSPVGREWNPRDPP